MKKYLMFFVFLSFLLALSACDLLSSGLTTTITTTEVTSEVTTIEETTTNSNSTLTTTFTTTFTMTQTTTIEDYRIIFNSNGGDEINDIIGISYGSSIILPIPEKTGYVFLGWYLGESINAERIFDTTPITEDMTLFARWEPQTYTVKFYNDSDLLYVEYVTYGASANAPTPPVIEGYSFAGWDKVFVEVKADLNIYAEYQINYYDLSFNPNGGTYVNDIKDIQYNTATELPVPEREGYDFLGWVSDDIVYNSHTNIKSDLYLVARWAETAYLEFEFNSESLTYDVSRYYGNQEHIIIPETYNGYEVTYIRDGLIRLSPNVKTIFIPKTIITIDDSALAFCPKLEEVIVDTDNEYFESIEGILYSKDQSTLYTYPAQKTGDTFIFPDRLLEVTQYAFAFNNFLKTVHIHKDFSTYREFWFRGCESLESIIVDSDNPYLTSIDGVLFNKDLTIIYKYPANKSGINYVIPNSVTIIFVDAFSNNRNLETVDIPEGVSEIQSFGFHFSNFISFDLPDSLTSIGYSAFGYNPNITTLTLPKNVAFIDRSAFEVTNLVEIIVDEDNQHFSSLDGVLYNKIYTLLHSYPPKKVGSIFVIPDSVIEIIQGAINNQYLKYIYIPNSVLNISISAFPGTGSLTILTEFSEPQENWTTAWNSRLVLDLENIDSTLDLFLYPVIYNVSEIGTFGDFDYFLKSDGTVAIIGQNIDSLNTNLTIPETINSYPVNEIRPYAFHNIQTGGTIDVPDTINIIGEYAFADSNITVNLVDYEVQPGWLDYWDHNVNINWGDEIRNITFDENGGSIVEDMTVIYGTEITDLAIPSRTGYAFDGWYLNDEKITLPYLYNIHGDVTLKAEWNMSFYEITYLPDGGTIGINPETYTIETPNINLSDSIKEGHTFDGWYDNEEFTGSPVTQIALGTTGDINLYAKWIINQYTITYIVDKDFDYIVLLETGAQHSLAVTSEEKLFTWGSNIFGQLGDGTTTNKSTPTDITSQFNLNEGETIVSISLGGFDSSAITSEGRIFTWGDNRFGQLGDGTTTDRLVPTDITSQFNLNEGESVISISLGSSHSSAITSEGRVFFWGYNAYGQLGDGTTTNRSTPTEITSQFGLGVGETIISISLGSSHSSAITSEGRILTWGDNSSGQLGDRTTTNKFVPTDITSWFNLNAGETIVSVELGSYFSAVITSEGRVFTWGSNSSGQLGIGSQDYNPHSTPIEITSNFDLASEEKVSSISLGGQHFSGITTEGRVFTCGDNKWGQLGDGTINNKLLPSEITSQFDLIIGEKIIQLPLGTTHSSAYTSDNRVFTWGYNLVGQLGDGTTTSKSTPQLFSINIVSSTTTAIYDYNESLEEYIPVREGYIFDGWYSDESLTTKHTLTTMPAEDMTLYANWIEALDNGEFLYRIQTDNTVVIVGLSPSNLNTVIVIPGVIDTYPVTIIGEAAFEDNKDITSITIPASVIEIEYNAFKSMTWLATVTFETGSNLEIIGDYAFKSCLSLTSIDIPEGVTEIGAYAFSWAEIASITLPSTLTTIGNNAFEQTWSLDSIVIPMAVTNMGSNVFYGSSLLEIYCEAASLPATWATDWNPDEITVNWDYVDILDNGEFLYTVETDNTVTILGISGSNASTAIVIPNTIDTYPVTVIGKRAFEDNKDITSITIPASVIEIEYNAFKSMTWLATVTFETGSNLEIIGDYAFKACLSLTSIDIPEGVTEIGAYAFSWAEIASITLPSTLTTIGNNAFEQTWSLDSIVIPMAVTNMGSNVFLGSSLLEIYCEAASLPATWATDWNPDEITVNWDYVDILDNGEFLYTVETDNTVTILGISESNASTAIVIPNTIDTYPVTVIGKRAFEDNKDITSITIPASVIEIEYNAFKSMTWLATVTFETGSNLEIIGDYAFKACLSLTSIDIPEGVTEIGAYAFSWAEIASITLPSTLTTIGDNAFEQTWSLDSIVIPMAVTNMGSNVFLGSSLLEIYCEAASLPATWATDWNPDEITVNWDSSI